MKDRGPPNEGDCSSLTFSWADREALMRGPQGECSGRSPAQSDARPHHGMPMNVMIITSSSQNLADEHLVESGRRGPFKSGVSTTVSVVVDAPHGLTKESAEAAAAKATWLHSTYHNVTAMLGAGVLGLPYTFAALGWVGGIIVLCGCLIIALYTFTLLVHLHENGPNHRFSRYYDLCQHAWGKRRGAWALLIFQIPFIFGLAVTYTVTGGESLGSFVALIKSGGTDSSSHSVLPLPVWIGIFSFVEILLAQLPNLDSLAWVSGVGAAMSIVYSVGASVLSLRSAEPRSEVNFTPLAGGGADCGPPLQRLMAVCSAITTIFFAYGGHNIAMEIQATLPFPPTTVRPMMQGVYSAFSLTFMCYALTASTGYYAFGSSAKANILQSAGSNPSWLLAACNLGVMFHVLASYQVYSSPLLELWNNWLTEVALLAAAPVPAAGADGIEELGLVAPPHPRASRPRPRGSNKGSTSLEHPLLGREAYFDAAALILEDGTDSAIASVDDKLTVDQEALREPVLHSRSQDTLRDAPAQSSSWSAQSSRSLSLVSPSPGLLSYALHYLGPGRQRFLLTLVYVASSCLLACVIPFFGSLMGLIGAIGAAPTNFVLPCLLWLKLRKPKPLVSITWWICWLLAIVGSLVGVFGAMGAIYGIVEASSSYEIFSH